MMSREFDYSWLSNHCSILLAMWRRYLSPSEFRILLTLQRASESWVERNSFPPCFEDLWLSEMTRQLEQEFEMIRIGKLRRRALSRLVHLVQHIFLGSIRVSELAR